MKLPESNAPADLAARRADGPEPGCDPVLETAILLDAVIHDLRTPLSAMSGWLEVLEAQIGAVDGLTGRALQGLRRGVDGQTRVLNVLSDTLMKQRMALPPGGDCLLLERMQQALQDLERRGTGSASPVETRRLAALARLVPTGSLTCADAGAALADACGVLLQALSIAQSGADAPITVTADAAGIRFTVPGGSGDPSPLHGLCNGLAGYATRRPDIRVQSLWLARTMLHRCGLVLQTVPADDGGFSLWIARRPAG